MTNAEVPWGVSSTFAQTHRECDGQSRSKIKFGKRHQPPVRLRLKRLDTPYAPFKAIEKFQQSAAALHDY